MKSSTTKSSVDSAEEVDLVAPLEKEMAQTFDELFRLQSSVKDSLAPYADGKPLKGGEIVGWLGEIFVKLLYRGTMVSDSEEHDVVTADGRKISVKARKGRGSGWTRTSAIPKIDGDESPTHLAFVHLHDNYSIDRIWLFDWLELVSQGRFKVHNVRGQKRSYVFSLDEKKDEPYVVYRGGSNSSLASS